MPLTIPRGLARKPRSGTGGRGFDGDDFRRGNADRREGPARLTDRDRAGWRCLLSGEVCECQPVRPHLAPWQAAAPGGDRGRRRRPATAPRAYSTRQRRAPHHDRRPDDVVVEPNILRAVAVGTTRETSQTRSANGPETSARPPAVAAADTTLWPLQPEPAQRPQRQVTPASPEETISWPAQPQSEPAARVSHAADHLAGLAAELGRTPAATENAAPQREPKRATAQSTPAPQGTATDQNLTEMAQRLEAALRHSPGARGGEPAAKPAPEPTASPRITGTNGASEPTRLTPSEVRAPRPEAKPTPPKALYDSLEQEMASLLGRPAGKA